MGQSYELIFWRIDPGASPAPGTPLLPETITVHDHDGDGILKSNSGDMIGGEKIIAIWPGDTLTVHTPQGPLTVTGMTFYLDADPHPVFIPTDGTQPFATTVLSSTWVWDTGDFPIPPGAAPVPVPCFVAGTLIATPGGPRRVEELRAGDLVETLDHGPQVLRWTGRRRVPGQGAFAPIRFAPGAMGNARALLVSPQHRMLVTGWRAELVCGAPEVLVAALHLVNGDTIRRMPRARVVYVHLLFDRHEVIFAEGAASESFHPGAQILAHDAALRAELLALFPDLAARAATRPTARPVLRRHEAALLAA